MKDGIWQVDGQREVQLSTNPAALNPRDIARAIRIALAETECPCQSAEDAAAWLAWLTDVSSFSGIDQQAKNVLGAFYDAMTQYAAHGAPPEPQRYVIDTDGEQQTF